MDPKSGSPVTAVVPTAPEEVLEADVAAPGKIAEVKVEQLKKKSGKYGSTNLPAHKATEEESSSDSNEGEQQEEVEESYVDIKLVDEDGNPVPGEKYEILLPDGTVAKGTLSNSGVARVEGFKSGDCKVSFPNLCKDAWSKQ